MSAEGRELCAITAAACREDGDGGMAASTQVRGLGEFFFERKGGAYFFFPVFTSLYPGVGFWVPDRRQLNC